MKHTGTVCVVITSLCQSQLGCGFRGSPIHRPKALSRLQVGPDHLIDCAQSPQLAELFGGSKSDVCLQTQMGLFSGVGGLFDQAVTIGFLVMSYFFFKRSANGVVDWIDTEVDDNDIIEGSLWSASRRQSRVGRTSNSMEEGSQPMLTTCPQCAGTGKFSWNEDVGEDDECELCEGTGKVETMQREKGTIYELPGSSKDE